MPQTLSNSTEFHEQTTSAPESGSEISDMVSSCELGCEVESQSHEDNQDPPVLPEYAKDFQDQGDEMINVEVGHIDNQPPHTESPPILNETIHDEAPHTESPPILNEKIHDETPPASPQNIQAFQERETIKHDTMGQDMIDIVPDPEPKV
ncbi:hypothetical protein O181_020095 [Austropuccinia psidii MF-1]|uniref:Uncharacterized protein n=1 Tax=Austropuccinia psidii MF-1 TaxID=1389203 RepID=A0A9Q3CBY7_9BASI|nr:hypothetical protein [Austropuccinia psidii MF-1]